MLKRELEFRDMQPSEDVMDMAMRLFEVRGMAKQDIPDRLKATRFSLKNRTTEVSTVRRRS